jgi:predicted nucleotidyltransferase
MARPVLAEEIDRRLAKAIEPVGSIRVAYLFGSRARGSARPDSDLDLAVAYDWRLDDWAREQARRDVIVALGDALGALGERADVVDLDRSFSGVAFEAIARGRCVLARTEEERVEIEVRVCRRYDDEAKYREAQRRAALAAFRT